MELRHFRYVIAVAEELHFSRAAARLNMSQPPLSQQIRQLEVELGVKLFYRTKREVQLTEAGRRFVDEARKALAQADYAVKVATRTSQGEIGQIMIGTITSTNSGFYRIFVEILQVFAKRYPDVHIALRTMPVVHQIEAVREGRIQAGFVTLPVDQDDLLIEKVQQEPLMVALPKDHPLSSHRTISAKAIAAEPHILFPRALAPGYYDQIVTWFRNAGFTLNVAHEADNIYTGLALVAAGAGLCLKPASLEKLNVHGVVFRELQAPGLQIEMGVVHRPDAQSNVLTSFLRVVRRVAAKKGARGRRSKT